MAGAAREKGAGERAAVVTRAGAAMEMLTGVTVTIQQPVAGGRGRAVGARAAAAAAKVTLGQEATATVAEVTATEATATVAEATVAEATSTEVAAKAAEATEAAVVTAVE